jgi:hypothetical protein
VIISDWCKYIKSFHKLDIHFVKIDMISFGLCCKSMTYAKYCQHSDIKRGEGGVKNTPPLSKSTDLAKEKNFYNCQGDIKGTPLSFLQVKV